MVEVAGETEITGNIRCPYCDGEFEASLSGEVTLEYEPEPREAC